MRLNRQNKSIAYLFAILIVLAGLPAYAGFEKASLRYDIPEPRKLALGYDVYAGGFRALKASLDLDLDKNAYDMSLSAKTEGFIGDMFPWEASYETSGHANDGQLTPTIYTSKSAWKKKVKFTEMNFDPRGNLLKMTTQEGNKTTVDRDVKKDLAQDAVDMLTGTLMMMQNTKNTDKCEGTFPVFDGKRRFNITLTDQGIDVIKQSDYSQFSGEALKCALKVEPVAGFKEKDKKRGWLAIQNHTEERKKPPTIWLSRLEEGGPVVPVRMEIASSYGTVVAHLSAMGKK